MKGSADYIEEICKRAWEDEEFKGRLLSDATATIEEVADIDLSGVKIHIHENTATEKHFVLPPSPEQIEAAQAVQSEALSDSELEMVVGGKKGGLADPSSRYRPWSDCEVVPKSSQGGASENVKSQPGFVFVAALIGWSWGWSAH